MRLAFVVQRYGREIRGGAELHCRLVAERLAARHEVAVVTTCAQDYVTWANAYPRGVDAVNGLPVWRFPVRRPRDPQRFGRLQERVFHRRHSQVDAEAWLDEQGPYSPALRAWVEEYRDRFDYWICFSYRYWTTYHALRAAPDRAILVPTAEPDPAIDLPIFHPLFRSARGIVFNSHEERRMILDRSGADEVPADIVGVGIQEPGDADPRRFRQRFGLDVPFFLYVGRLDENKGCRQLFDFFIRAHGRLGHADADDLAAPHLVLIGHPVLPVPDHPAIHHLGTVEEQDKYDALAAATALVMPSFYESLSMVLLEAWSLHKPVLVNGQCDVLRGQVARSGGGLYYRDGDEFCEAFGLLASDEQLRRACGEGGHAYYEANYTWPVIEDKYERLLARLAADDAPAASVDASVSIEAAGHRRTGTPGGAP